MENRKFNKNNNVALLHHSPQTVYQGLFCRVDPVDKDHECDGENRQQDESQLLYDRLSLHAVESFPLVLLRTIQMMMVMVMLRCRCARC
mgnify:CR=1